MTRLHDLAAAGTSPWLDNIRRSWLESGVFRRKVDDGIVGVTSNPTIFQKAIADSSDYDEAIRATRRRVARRTCSSSWRSRTSRTRPTS